MVPTFIFQVEYDFTAGILTVHIVKCEDLPAMDIGGTSDPYVKVHLLPGASKSIILIKENLYFRLHFTEY